MKNSELETMRKSFNTVKSRSSEIKDSPQVKRLEDKVREIKKYSIQHSDELYNQVIESFNRNGIDVEGEIDLKSNLADKNWNVVETDLGDRILQLKKTDNKPVHPTGPASHLNISEITDIVNDSLNSNVNPIPREIMELVREDVLNLLKNANVGISGANAIASEEGSCVMVHNEGNISLVSLKDLHIIVKNCRH